MRTLQPNSRLVLDDGQTNCGPGSSTQNQPRNFGGSSHGSAASQNPLSLKHCSLIDGQSSSLIAHVFPLYLQVCERSKLHFEKLTEKYFCDLGRRMGDKVHFFLWRRNGRIVAFATCMIHGDAIYAEYIGLDYNVALDLHLYHYVFRDLVSWAIAHGHKWFRSMI